jgi:membrane complex biogenesis BtpA family protein
MWLREVFGTEHPIIGMVHLKAMPGTPLHDEARGIDGILEAALQDLRALQRGGVDAVLFCNENDRPYALSVGPAVVAAMTGVVARLRRDCNVPYGVDVLWDPEAAIAVAHGSGAQFVREVFTGAYAGDLGVWSPDCAKALRFRNCIGAGGIKLLFNILPEFSSPLVERPVDEVARTTVFSSLADAICVSGVMAGTEVSVEQLRRVKEALPDVPVFANTGVRHENVGKILSIADGAIVGSSFKIDGKTLNAVDEGRVIEFMQLVRRIRETVRT